MTDNIADRSRCCEETQPNRKFLGRSSICEQHLISLQNGPSWLIVDCSDKPGGKYPLFCSRSSLTSLQVWLAPIQLLKVFCMMWEGKAYSYEIQNDLLSTGTDMSSSPTTNISTIASMKHSQSRTTGTPTREYHMFATRNSGYLTLSKTTSRCAQKTIKFDSLRD